MRPKKKKIQHGNGRYKLHVITCIYADMCMFYNSTQTRTHRERETKHENKPNQTKENRKMAKNIIRQVFFHVMKTLSFHYHNQIQARTHTHTKT